MILWTSRASHTYILLILIFYSYENRRFVDFLAHFFKKNHCFGEGAERATSNRNSDEFSSDTPLFLKGTPHSTADTPFFECDTPQKSKIHPKNCCFEVGSFSINFFVATQNRRFNRTSDFSLIYGLFGVFSFIFTFTSTLLLGGFFVLKIRLSPILTTCRIIYPQFEWKTRLFSVLENSLQILHANFTYRWYNLIHRSNTFCSRFLPRSLGSCCNTFYQPTQHNRFRRQAKVPQDRLVLYRWD